MSEAIEWHSVTDLAVEGRGWDDTAAPFDRLPARASGAVRPPVWELSRCSAGICVRFSTDAPVLHARWTLRSASLAMSHMAATGVSGLDLYARTEDGPWRWVACGRPEHFPTNQVQLVAGLSPHPREYLLYLPLYNGVTAVDIGTPPGASCEAGPPRPAPRGRPIVFYGTSITQGGCAARPGMAHTALLGRWLDWHVLNLGFSGNGTMDPEVATLMAEIDAAAYVIDCLPNMSAELVTERTEPLVAVLRGQRPQSPIVLVEDRTATNAYLLDSTRAAHAAKRAALRAAYERLCAAGDAHLHYQPGADFMGDDCEATVDGSHPTDLGFLRQARSMLPLLRQVLTA